MISSFSLIVNRHREVSCTVGRISLITAMARKTGRFVACEDSVCCGLPPADGWVILLIDF